MSWLSDGSIVLPNASWVPSLLDLRVGVVSAVKIFIDLGENGDVYVINVVLESVVEDNLVIGQPSQIVLVVRR